MTLAQKFDRPPAARLEVLPPASAPSGTVARAPIDFRQLSRRVVAAAPAAPAVRPDAVLTLLEEVATALHTLMARCQEADDALAATRQQAKSELDAAHAVAREWQQEAHSLRAQIERAEKDLATTRARAEAAEQESVSAKLVADRSSQAAAEAECLSSLFQEKVITSFGVGSAGHMILESVRGRTQQMLSA